MKEDKVAPTDSTYSTLISACGKEGQWKEALKVFEAMRKYSIAPNIRTMSGEFRWMSGEFRWMSGEFRWMNIRTYRTLLLRAFGGQ